MNRFGLALSGGGFRAVLYHLGLVRFLRDAGILSRVTHISSVSGGSIIAAHLVLNWDRYNGSPNEFDAAASELVSFVRLDVRNRIFRRFPLEPAAALAAPASGPLESQIDANGATGIPLREVSLWRHQSVPVARAAGTAHPRHEPERGMPLLLQPERLVDDAPATRARRSHRANPRRAGHGADGRHRLVGLPRVLPAGRAHRRGRRRQRRRVRPAGVHRRRRLRQPRRPVVPLPGTAAPGGEFPVRRRLFRFSRRRRDIVRGRQVRRGNTASPARSDHRGGLQPAGPAVTHRAGDGRAGQASRLSKGRARWEVQPPLPSSRPEAGKRPGSGSRAARSLGRFCANTRSTASRSSPG